MAIIYRSMEDTLVIKMRIDIGEDFKNFVETNSLSDSRIVSKIKNLIKSEKSKPKNYVVEIELISFLVWVFPRCSKKFITKYKLLEYFLKSSLVNSVNVKEADRKIPEDAYSLRNENIIRLLNEYVQGIKKLKKGIHSEEGVSMMIYEMIIDQYYKYGNNIREF